MSEPRRKSERLLDLAFDDVEIKANAKLVFLIMCRRGNASGVCFMAIDTLEKESGLCRSTVSRSLRSLRQSGRIVLKGRKPGSVTWSYSLHPQRQSDARHKSKSAQSLGKSDLQNQNQNQKENLVEPVERVGTVSRQGSAVQVGRVASRLVSKMSR